MCKNVIFEKGMPCWFIFPKQFLMSLTKLFCDNPDTSLSRFEGSFSRKSKMRLGVATHEKVKARLCID